MIEAASFKERKGSLPKLAQKEKMSLLWLMGQNVKS